MEWKGHTARYVSAVDQLTLCESKAKSFYGYIDTVNLGATGGILK